MFNPDIYRSYDIRGIVPDEFDPAEAYHIGRAFAQHTSAQKVVVARDMRSTSDAIEIQLLRGLSDAGVDVLKIGQATSPLFYFSIHKLEADGGLMVTASHNPGAYNGIKMTRAEAVPIGGDSGLVEIRDLVEKRQWSEATEGSLEEVSVKKEYLDLVTDGLSAQGLKIVVDAGNGMAGMLLPDVFTRIGGDVVDLYWKPDGTFPNHEADPLKEENMADLQATVKEHGADLGVAFDGDGDRVFFTTEEGEIVPGDFTTALIAEEILAEHPGRTILYDLRSSRSTAETINAADGIPSMWKVGHSNIKAQMRKENAVFAGELSGHLYFTPWYAESGLLAMNYIIKKLQKSGQSMSELTAPLKKYSKTPEINFEVADKDAALNRLKEAYSDAEILEIDGVSVIYNTWWVNVRPSNTEPLLRLNLEANTPEEMQQRRQEVEALITQ